MVGTAAGARRHRRPARPWRREAAGWWLVTALGLGGVAGPATAAPVPGLEETLCGGRTPCRLLPPQEAGQNRAEQELLVAELQLFDPGAALDEPAAQGAGSKPTNPRKAAPPSPPPCRTTEHWLVVAEGGAISSRQLLLRGCQETSAPGTLPAAETRVAPDRFTAVHRHGTIWQSTTEQTLQLSPLSWIAESRTAVYRQGRNNSHLTWNWETFSGSLEWYSPWCKPDGEPEEADEGSASPYRSLPIPRIELFDDTPATAAWATAGLGRCGTRLDSSGQQGFLLQGPPSTADDAELAVVLATPNTLLVEIHDDRWIGSSKTPQVEDQLAIWTGPQLSYENCLDRATVVQEWRIRVLDGKLLTGPGLSLEKLTIERQPVVLRGGKTALRLRVTLPSAPGSLTVGYGDGDDGQTLERLVATSALVPGVPSTLGIVFPIDARQAVCEVRKDRLEPRRLPIPPGPAPVLKAP
ncbi:MAG: hypothetical protein RBU45_07535 [Myxococcota bacterium]|nr:hypothetical protein [Myxococcota bacterium]